jgi:hypothetical protein
MWAFMQQQQQQQQMMLMELLAKRTGTEDPARRFTMREAGSLPKGTPHDLQNLDQWMAEFERLAKLKGGDMQEKCSWIVNCWDLETTAGKKAEERDEGGGLQDHGRGRELCRLLEDVEGSAGEPYRQQLHQDDQGKAAVEGSEHGGERVGA